MNYVIHLKKVALLMVLDVLILLNVKIFKLKLLANQNYNVHIVEIVEIYKLNVVFLNHNHYVLILLYIQLLVCVHGN